MIRNNFIHNVTSDLQLLLLHVSTSSQLSSCTHTGEGSVSSDQSALKHRQQLSNYTFADLCILLYYHPLCDSVSLIICVVILTFESNHQLLIIQLFLQNTEKKKRGKIYKKQ